MNKKIERHASYWKIVEEEEKDDGKEREEERRERRWKIESFH